MISWFCSYPMDVIKTKMMTWEHSDKQRPKMSQVVKAIIREQGVKGLYRGVHVQMMRAFPTTATGIVVFEMTQQTLKNW